MRQKGFIILPVIIFVFLLAVVGYLTYQNTKLRSSKVGIPQPTDTSVLKGTGNNIVGTPTTKPTIDPTANWKTYKNSAIGFELKYPSNLEVVGVGFEVPNVTNAKVIALEKMEGNINKTMFVVNVDQQSNSYSKTSLAEFVDKNYLDNKNNENKFFTGVVSEPHTTKFLGYNAYEYSFNGKGFSTGYVSHFGNEGIINILIFERNGQFLIIGYYKQEPFNQILSTFKFTQ